MPVYELLCLAKPKLPRGELVGVIQRIGELIMDKGGVLMDVRSYGDQHLAYDIRRPFERYSQAHVWQMNFMLGPHALKDINHELSVNRNVLRWMNIKRSSKLEGTLAPPPEAADASSSPPSPSQ